MTTRPSRTSLRRLLTTGLIALSLGVASCGDDSDTPSVTGTEPPTTTAATFEVTGDDFYTAPEPLPGAEHGDLIWAEPVESWWGSPRRAWRVLYRSESVAGDPIAVSGYVIAPERTDGGPLPVIAWAHGTVGSADVCAPSRSFAEDPSSSPASASVSSQLLAAVDAGAIVVATDYEGLGTPGPHPFLVGESQGRGVIDSVLAVRQLPGVDAGDDVVVYGVSQGGQSALWAGQIAADWAPDLNLLGVISAAPFSEVDLLLPAAATIPGGEGYLVLGVFGQAAANPALDPAEVLDSAAIERASLVEERCADEVLPAFRQLAMDTGRPIAHLDALATPEWKEQLVSIKPGTAPMGSPVLVVQGDRDVTIPAATTRILVNRMCAAGDTVATVNKPAAGHGDIVTAADAEIRAFLNGRLAGEPATSSCQP